MGSTSRSWPRPSASIWGCCPRSSRSWAWPGCSTTWAKARIPDTILNKPGRLTKAEFLQIKRHPLLGRDILWGLPLSESVLRGVAEHHERFDGSGYPKGLVGDAIHPWGSILAVADVYDAMTSRRSYKGPMLPTRSLAVIHGMRGRDFPVRLAERFIKFLGPYPVGSFVRLTNG